MCGICVRMATCTELYIDTLGGLDLDGSTDKNLPYFVVENLATLGGDLDPPARGDGHFWGNTWGRPDLPVTLRLIRKKATAMPPLATSTEATCCYTLYHYATVLSVVTTTRTTGSACTRRRQQRTVQRTGWTGIRRRTAGGVIRNRTSRFGAFAIRPTGSKTDRATQSSAIRANFAPVSSKFTHKLIRRS